MTGIGRGLLSRDTDICAMSNMQVIALGFGLWHGKTPSFPDQLAITIQSVEGTICTEGRICRRDVSSTPFSLDSGSHG